MMTTSRGQALLFPEDVAEIWTEERRKVEGPDAPAVPVDRVHDIRRWSNPTPAGVKRKHRYEDHPMPYPRGTRGPRQPAWHADQEADLRAFWHDRIPTSEERYGRALTEQTEKEAAERRKTAGERRKAEWDAAALTSPGRHRRSARR